MSQRFICLALVCTFILAGCTGPAAVSSEVGQPAASTVETSTPVPATFGSPETVPTAAPTIAAPQVSRTEQDEIMAGLFQQIPFDGIRPIYNPTFAKADQVELQPDELVMGLVVDGEAKAYPVTVLRLREMVNDEIAGIPILVTW